MALMGNAAGSIDEAEPAAEVEFALVDAHWRIVATNRQWRDAAAATGAVGLRQGECYKDFWVSQHPVNWDSASHVLRGMRALECNELPFFECERGIGVLKRRARISIVGADAMEASYAIAIGPAGVHFPFDDWQSQVDQIAPAEEPLAEHRTREDERRRIARDLHDSAAQHLTGINLGLAHLRQISEDPDIRFIVDGLSNCLSRFHRDLRGLSYLLHPPELEEFGFTESVRALCDGLVRRSGLHVDLLVEGEGPCSPAAETAIYRVLQEALFNVLRHARACRTTVRLRISEDAVMLVVADDGIGLNQSRPSTGIAVDARGVGLKGMRALVGELGGRFVVRERPGGAGTIVAARVRSNSSKKEFSARTPG